MVTFIFKIIPKASPELIKEAGLYADRLSVNMEIPTESGLKLLAPEKKHEDMAQPMAMIKNEILNLKDSKKHIKTTPKFARAGQSSQLIIGAAQETDVQVIKVADRYFDLNQIHLIHSIDHLAFGNPENYSEDGLNYQKIWQGYFASVNITERNNPKLHVKQLLKRY